MNQVIDALASTSGWVGTGSVTASALNQNKDYIVGYQAGSVVFHFPSGSNGERITKTITSIDVTSFDTLVFHVWSRNRRRGQYRSPSDCSYKLGLGGGKEFYFRTHLTFAAEILDISGVDSISEITFEAAHDDDDYLIVSYMVASTPDLPRDLYDGMIAALNNAFDHEFPSGIPVGTATFAAGASAVVISGAADYLWRYTVIEFDDGANQETHQIMEADQNGVVFGPLYNGKTTVNAMTDATVYLKIPPEAYRIEEEAAMPGFTLFGMEPQPIRRHNDAVRFFHTYTDTGVVEETEGLIFDWPVNIDLYCRNEELMAAASRVIRRVMAEHRIFVNGFVFEFDAGEPPSEILPVDAVDSIPNLTYTVTLEVKEQTWRTARTLSGAAAITATPRAASQPLIP